MLNSSVQIFCSDLTVSLSPSAYSLPTSMRKDESSGHIPTICSEETLQCKFCFKSITKRSKLQENVSTNDDWMKYYLFEFVESLKLLCASKSVLSCSNSCLNSGFDALTFLSVARLSKETSCSLLFESPDSSMDSTFILLSG